MHHLIQNRERSGANQSIERRSGSVSLSIIVFSVVFTLAYLSAPRARAAVADEPIYDAIRLDGTTASGRIDRIENAEVRLSTDYGQPVTAPLTALFKIHRRRGMAAGIAAGPLVLLADGDRLHVDSIGQTDENTLEVRASQLASEPFRLPLQAISTVLFSMPLDADEGERLLARVRQNQLRGEWIWLKNGDQIVGSVFGIAEKSVSFQPDGADAANNYERDKLTVLRFDPAGGRATATPPGTWFEITLDDGSRFGAIDVKTDRHELECRTRYGPVLRVPLNRLVTVYFKSESVVFLTDRVPLDTAFAGYLDDHPGIVGLNAGIGGLPLQIGRERCERGIGVRPKTLIAYRVEPGDQAFQSAIGLDDRAGPLASVVFRVLVNGQERFTSGPFTAADPPRLVNIPLAGARSLVLVTEFGTRGDVQDEAVWADARVIRSR
jgi:hypothetical protein